MLRHQAIHPGHLWAFVYLFGIHLGVPKNCGKQYNKSVFWLFWTISPERMDLTILLGAYLYA
jgi:hypothetical protein